MDQGNANNLPPAIARREGGFVYFDTPESGVCGLPIVACSGWTIRDGHDISFEINGTPIENIRSVKRAGVKSLYPDADVAGFEFWIDANRHMRAPNRALHLVARGRETLAERFFYLRPRDAAQASASQLTFFLHMSKTAGTAIRRRMEMIAAAASRPYEGILAAYHIPHLLGLRADTLSYYDFVFGHFWYGAHQIARGRPHTYLTVLREPFDYLESLYFYWKNVVGLVAHASVFDFLDDPKMKWDTDNHFTRMLTGMVQERLVTSEDMRIAIDNIDREFAFVGLVEEMPRTLHRLSVLTGFDLRDTGRENVTPPSEERKQLDRQAFAAAARGCLQYDVEIYRYVRSKFFVSGA